MMALGHAIWAAALGAALLPASPATACSRVPYKASNYRIDTRAMPAMMLASAATVDVAVAESVDRSAQLGRFDADEATELANATSDAERTEIRTDYAAMRDQWRRSGGGAVTYRVVERLKGASTDTFSLTAFVPLENESDFASQLKKYIAERGAFLNPEATWAMSVRELNEWGGLGSCASPVFAILGVNYLVFRGSNGRLLEDGVSDMSKLDGRFQPSTRDGPVYQPVLLKGDAWLKAVRAAAADR
jgi:hypothetical protein